jgi:ABC-type maltose transport system permease subunit
MMKLWTYFDERAKRIGIMDTKLVQGAAMCIAVVIVKMFPGILNISAGWFIAAALLLAIKPMMTFFGSDRPS